MTLHTHSEHSFLDGRARCDEIALAARKNGRSHVAITDHDEVGGHLDHQRACLAQGIKPIFGTEARWLHSIPRSRAAKTSGRDSSHIVLLAADRQGLKNLWALSSLAYEPENFYGKPQLDPEIFRRYSRGLWASDGCALTRFADHVFKGDEESARMEWAVLLDVFGDRFYSELHTWMSVKPVTDEEKELDAKVTAMNQAKVRLAQEMGVPLVIVNDSHYAFQDQWEEHRLVYNLSTQAYRRDQVESKGQAADWMMNDSEMTTWMLRHGIPDSVISEALKNSEWIADQCDVEIGSTLSMPLLYPTDAEDAKAFRRNIEEGFRKFVVDKGLDENLYRERLEYESRLIVDKGMAGYFNVVADYVMAARDGSYVQWVDPRSPKTPCLCGPGRGSGGGSLVNYVLGITSLDPIKYDLMFERFINPDRPDYPDIDVDFQKSQRGMVKEYLSSRYGPENVCSIGTRSRSGPKQMLKDLGRAMSIPASDINKMAALIEQVESIEQEDSDGEHEPLGWDEIISRLDNSLSPWARKYRDLFVRLEHMVGLVRQAGVHAAGVVINPEPLLGNVPTRVKRGDGIRATQFDMHEISLLGGVKEDLLANKGLDVLAIARDLILRRHGVWLDYDGFGFGPPQGSPVPRRVIVFGDEQYNDPDIWHQIDLGQTAGIFQIGTNSGTKQAVRFKPRSLVDLADLTSINRPGVIRAGQLDHYLSRRNGEEPVVYDHPLMEPITGPSSSMNTYGILVYQEQLIRTARDLAGFSAGQAEELRKAIGKKLADKIAEIRPMFLRGCMDNPDFTSNGGDESTALKIWSSLEAAGSYAFNKAHATGYAMQPCWEIWTKHYYFDEFIVACLSVDSEKTSVLVRECRKRGRPILLPDINLSGEKFTLTDRGIRYGLTDIRGLGGAMVEAIIKERDRNGPFKSLRDYINRVDGGAKKGVLDSLIKVGAFDCFTYGGEKHRQELLDEVYYYRAQSEVAERKWSGLTEDQRNEIVAQKWEKKPDDYPEFDFSSPDVISKIEIEVLGDTVTVDPMEDYAPMIEAECVLNPLEILEMAEGSEIAIGGQLVRVQPHKQKNGRKMAFLTVRWDNEEFEVVSFADSWRSSGFLLREIGAPVVLGVTKLAGKGCSLKSVIRLDLVYGKQKVRKEKKR